MTTAAKSEFLEWRSGERDFALELPYCREIVMNVPVTRLPRAPQFVLGLANLRGNVISVIDLEVLLGYRGAGHRGDANLIRLRTEGHPIAVAADQVNDTRFLSPEDLEAAPANLGDAESSFIRRVAKNGGGLILVPDLRAIVNSIL